jgi:hypothetical protein
MEYVRRGTPVAASRSVPSVVLKDRRQREAASAVHAELRAHGCTPGAIECGGKNHIKLRFVTADGAAGFVTISSSPSDYRAMQNMTRSVRKIVRQCAERGTS